MVPCPRTEGKAPESHDVILWWFNCFHSAFIIQTLSILNQLRLLGILKVYLEEHIRNFQSLIAMLLLNRNYVMQIYVYLQKLFFFFFNLRHCFIFLLSRILYYVIEFYRYWVFRYFKELTANWRFTFLQNLPKSAFLFYSKFH